MFVNVADIKGDIKLSAQFGARSFGNHQKLVEISNATPLKSFGNIGHD